MTGTPTVEVVTVTPEMARAWLEKNTHNRVLARKNVDQLAGAIRRGEWSMNGESVKFSASGMLLDGQHRLAAVVTAKQPIVTLVVRGLDRAAQETIDTGKKRTLPDVLKLRGEQYATILAAALNVVHRIRGGQMNRGAAAYPTAQQALALLEQHPTIRAHIKTGRYLNDRLRYPAGLGCGLAYLFHQDAPADADSFLTSLITGERLAEGSPILLLRRQLERRAMRPTHDERERMEVVAAWTIKGWNAWRAGVPLQRISWIGGGSQPEPFPQIGTTTSAARRPPGQLPPGVETVAPYKIPDGWKRAAS
jgi:hypothetical protein